MPIPTPSENAEIWDSITLGKGVLPPKHSEGSVEVKVRAKAKLDTKRKGGGKPSTTRTQSELAEVTITLRFTEAIWPEIEAALLELQPGSGPHKIGHPKTRLAGVDAVSIESFDGPDWDAFQVGTIVWSCKQWVPPAPDAVKKAPSSATTPESAVPFENAPWTSAGNKPAVAQKGLAEIFRHATERVVAGAAKK